MTVSGLGSRSAMMVQSLVDMRRQLDDLQRQLGTGKKAMNYADMGLDRGLATGLRSQLAGIDGFNHTIDVLGVRLNLGQTVLTRMTELRTEAKSSLHQSAELGSGGQSAAQGSARNQLSELLELLNTQVNGRYLFSGRALDQPAVESLDHILNGDGARAGLRQIIDERLQADLGASGLGRVTLGVAAATVTIAEDAAPSPFGFKLNAAVSNLTGATIAGPAGAPPQIDIALASNPLAGETIEFTLDLPDGSRERITLTATTDNPPPAGRFTIGATPALTAANLNTALTTAVDGLAKTSLAAASALAAAEDFFAIGAGDPPMRVSGPPFNTATAQVAGTAANTVFWYTGEMAADSPRSAATARVDTSISVEYGMRANEQGIRWLVQNVAAFAATTFDPNSPDAVSKYSELTERLMPALSDMTPARRIETIATDISHAQMAIQSAKERHQETENVLGGLLDSVEGVSTEQVAASILALQTRLQASLQTTSSLYRISLIDYL